MQITHGTKTHNTKDFCEFCELIKQKYPLNTFHGHTQMELVNQFIESYENGWDAGIANLEGIHKREIKKYKEDMERMWGSTNNLLKKDKLVDKINSYSSASSRANNEYERGVSAGIEMFREYLLSDKKRIVKK